MIQRFSRPPLVSIVIPAYNHGKYLASAVQSVLDQNYSNIELIVIDDGSTDNTAEVLRSFNDDIFWESQANSGQSFTLNKGWSRARGDVLGYLSADDSLLPDAVKKLVATISSHQDIVAAFPDFQLIDPQSKHIKNVCLGQFNYRTMIKDVVCPIGPGAIFSRDAYEKTGGWDENLLQMPDYDFWLRIGLQGKIAHLDEILASFRVHDDSQTYSQVNIRRSNEPVQIINNYFSLNLPIEIMIDKNKAQSSAAMVSAQLNLRAGRFKKAYEMFKLAYKYSPKTVLTVKKMHLLFNALFNRHIHKILWTVR